MTIKLRERLFWGFFALSTAALVGAVLVLWLTGVEGVERARIAVFPGDEPGLFYAALAVVAVCGVYAAVMTGSMAIQSGKTVSVELFFFSLWVFTQSMELARVTTVVMASRGAGYGAYEMVTRLVLAGRYGGAMALFMGSLFSVGLKQERGMPIFMVTVVSALFFSSMQPLNSVGPGSDLLVERGIVPMAFAFEVVLLALAGVNYTIAWRTSRDRAYLWAGLGMILCAASSGLMKVWLAPLVILSAVPLLIVGTWLHVKSLHDYYLWR
ncbi:MAG: hypothetical protein JXM71_02075 [Spirochaetales bacterium]|nr:hypothetical protein [Spirochaetales bacterium]